jgi:D-tagatose-1,6-bisphosphate aldolase subunit GatZ/KbaZ
VLKAAMKQAQSDGSLLLIESTSNQVDQFGGYTGMTPQTFMEYVNQIAKESSFPADKIILGGDHLGPNVWQDRDASEALTLAEEQVRAYIRAGFLKIHLDTSMALGDDKQNENCLINQELIASRTAKLCAAAENEQQNMPGSDLKPLYIIGAEVPLPGGARHELEDICITGGEEVEETYYQTKNAFEKLNLQDAWQRVIAMVVQPGVEFSDTQISGYNSEKIQDIVSKIKNFNGIAFEAHSTDYQEKETLRQMVEDHFAILKVGPWLTFALREALFALESIEKEWLGLKRAVRLSELQNTIESIMKEKPKYWQKHYHGNNEQLAFARKYSYSDRVRYYWSQPEIKSAVDTLIKNLSREALSLNLVSQFMPVQYSHIRDGIIENNPLSFIYDKINEVTSVYSYATDKNGAGVCILEDK